MATDGVIAQHAARGMQQGPINRIMRYMLTIITNRALSSHSSEDSTVE